MKCGRCNTCGTWMEPCPRCKGKGTYDGYSCKHCRGIGCICPKHGAYTGSSGGGCFITTATLQATGKPDNCDELNTFRAFRDNWMAKSLEGRCQIEEYYKVAPRIVAAINLESNSKEIYSGIWAESLQPCFLLIKQGKYEEARVRYVLLISMLKGLYDHSAERDASN